MATLLPPPSKRQRTETAERARQQQEIQSIPENLGSIRVQFFDQATGSATGPAVSVPVADASVKNLETLLNTLQGNVGMQRGIVQHTSETNWFLRRRKKMSEYRTGSHTNPMAKTRTTRQSISSPTCITPS